MPNAQPVPRVRGLPAPSALASASSFLSGSRELVSCRWLADRLFPFRTGTRKPRWAGSARWHPRKETRKRKRGRGRRRTREGKGGRRRSKAPLRGALQPLRQRWPAPSTWASGPAPSAVQADGVQGLRSLLNGRGPDSGPAHAAGCPSPTLTSPVRAAEFNTRPSEVTLVGQLERNASVTGTLGFYDS